MDDWFLRLIYKLKKLNKTNRPINMLVVRVTVRDISQQVQVTNGLNEQTTNSCFPN